MLVSSGSWLTSNSLENPGVRVTMGVGEDDSSDLCLLIAETIAHPRDTVWSPGLGWGLRLAARARRAEVDTEVVLWRKDRGDTNPKGVKGRAKKGQVPTNKTMNTFRCFLSYRQRFLKYKFYKRTELFLVLLIKISLLAPEWHIIGSGFNVFVLFLNKWIISSDSSIMVPLSLDLFI